MAGMCNSSGGWEVWVFNTSSCAEKKHIICCEPASCCLHLRVPSSYAERQREQLSQHLSFYRLFYLPSPFSQLAGPVYTDGNYSCVWSSFSEPFPSLSWGKVGGGMGWTDGRKMTDQSWSIQNVGVRGYTAESVSALFFSSPLIIFNYHSVVLSIKLIFLSMSNNSKILLPSLLFHLKPIV